MTEEWRDIPGYEECYQASTLGRIRSLSRTYTMRNGLTRSMTGRVLKSSPGGSSGQGYLIVILSVGGDRVTRTVHSLVAETFLGPRPEGMEVCHGPSGHLDNSVSNLRYDTHLANQWDMIDAGNHSEIRKTACKRGHDLIAPNLTNHGTARGIRQCRACFVAHNWRGYMRSKGSIVSDSEFQQYSDRKYAQIMSRSMLRDAA